MTTAPTNPSSGAVPTGGPPGELAGGVLGLPSVLFCIVTGAAPLAAMLFNVPVATLGGGYASPAAFIVATVALTIRSEEHTSELQSQFHLVCRLLLEKK